MARENMRTQVVTKTVGDSSGSEYEEEVNGTIVSVVVEQGDDFYQIRIYYCDELVFDADTYGDWVSLNTPAGSWVEPTAVYGRGSEWDMLSIMYDSSK